MPGTHLLEMSYQPSWEVVAFTEVCPRINLHDPQDDCANVLLRDAQGPRQDPPFLLPDDEVERCRPKAWDYGLLSAGAQGVGLQLGSMEPGGLQLTRMAFGALLLLLAQVFQRGVRLEHDQRLTV